MIAEHGINTIFSLQTGKYVKMFVNLLRMCVLQVTCKHNHVRM